MDVYMSLSTGGTLWSVDKDQIANPKELFASLGASEISYWVSTPSFAEVCLMDPSFKATLLPQLKRFLFCGEILTHDCATKLTQRFPRATVENLYGPTEATVAVTTLTITPDILSAFNPLPVGRVKPDAMVLIMDADQLTAEIASGKGILPHRPEVLAEGKTGELIIAGPNVSVGYLNNPEQTAKAFFNWQECGVTWKAYRTGDAGLFKEGLLFYQGRLDFQIKLHGYRIELGEIEENLRRLPRVENAVVLPIERRGKIEYLQAFIVAGKPVRDEFKAVLDLKEALREHLPEYMIPRRFRFLEKMPMTSNGKVESPCVIRRVIMTPYESSSFFLYLFIPLIPAVLLGILGASGRVRAVWILISTLGMIFLIARPLSVLYQIVGYLVYEWLLVRLYLALPDEHSGEK